MRATIESMVALILYSLQRQNGSIKGYQKTIKDPLASIAVPAHRRHVILGMWAT